MASVFSWKSLFGENKDPWGASALRTKSNLKFKLILSGKTLNSHEDFITRLNQLVHLKEVNTEDECDFILGFCPIVTRPGIDIEAAMKRLHNISDTKPVVLVVLHHTFDPECDVPDSIKYVNRKNMIAVDCLFYEDKGLMQCLKNNESLDKTSQYLKEYINCKNMKRQKEGERSVRNSARSIKKEVTGLEGTNMKPDQTTNVSEESENSQPERNKQLNPEHIDTDNVEDMEQRNESQEKIMKQNLKRNKEPLTENTQTLQKKDKTLEEKKKQLSEVREELRKSNLTLEINQKQLEDTERQLESVVKELETSTNKLDTLGQELQDKQRQLQDMMIVVEQQKSELAEKKQQFEEKDRVLTERETQLMGRDKELQEKDRLLAKTRQKLEIKDETLEQKGTQLFQLKKKVKYYEVVPPKVQAPCEQFTKELKKIRYSMEMSTEEKCKVILYYVPIVSRAGTDIEAALQKLNSFGDKYIALVMLHQTSDRELIIPDSSRTVTREKTFIVDCLFSEDEGLFSCRKNDEAIKKVADWLKVVKHDKQDPKKEKEQHVKLKKQEQELRQRTSINEEKDEGLNDTIIKPKKMTLSNETQEGTNTPHERNQQLNNIEIVEEIEKRNEMQEQIAKENKEALKYLKEMIIVWEKQKTDLEGKNRDLLGQLEEKERQLESVVKELETSTNKLDTLGQDKQRQLQDMMIVVEQQKSEIAEKQQQLEEKDRLLTERETQLMGRDKELQEKDRLLTKTRQKL